MRGDLVAVDFVPNNFRFIDVEKYQAEEDKKIAASQPPPPAAMTGADAEAQRKSAMTQAIKSALRRPLADEKREIGFIEKVECSSKGMFFFIKNAAQTFKLSVTSPQAIQIRAFAPEVEQLQFGCNLKKVDIPVIFTFKEDKTLTAKSDGEIISLEFMPKGFELDK